MMSRVTVSNQAKAKIFYWSHFECEICGCNLPFQFKTGTKNRKFTLFEHGFSEEENFIVLELQNLDRSTQKYVFILTPTDDNCEFFLGRGTQ